MGLLARLAAKQLGIAPRYPVEVRRNLRVPMPDGIDLHTDVYEPRGLARSPTVLIRSPYGRRPFGLSMAAPFATQGYHVVLQSCRGTAGSGGVFDPHHDERDDGLATVEWIKAQPFFDGSIVTYGLSYLGYTQWAIAQAAGPEVRAMAMQVTISDFSRMTYAGDSLLLETSLSWTQLVTWMKSARGRLRLMAQMLLRRPALSAAQWRSLPLASLDEVATGERVPFWRDWMEHASPEDPWWQPMNFHRTIPEVRRPIHLVAGWHDLFTPWSLRDFAALRRAGAPVHITIGPWRHTDAGIARAGMQEALDWFAHHLGQRRSEQGEAVKLYVIGADEWRHYDQWPPKESSPATWYLQPDAGLARDPAPDSQPDRYRYDPADPTPSLGGPAMTPPRPFAVDNRALEARGDVRCFTSAPLAGDLDVIGVPSADLVVSSSAASADFFVRLCDVDPSGVSRNVCDGLQRIAIREGGDPQAVHIDLWPTAYRFRGGHRLRVQISSGAFPRWARNLGTGERLGTGAAMRVAEQSIHHSPARPSALTLPVCAPALRSPSS